MKDKQATEGNRLRRVPNARTKHECVCDAMYECAKVWGETLGMCRVLVTRSGQRILPGGNNVGLRKGPLGSEKGPGEKAARGRQPRSAEGTMRSKGGTGENGCQGETTSAGGRDHGGREEEPGRMVARGRQPRLAEWTMGIGRRDL